MTTAQESTLFPRYGGTMSLDRLTQDCRALESMVRELKVENEEMKKRLAALEAK